MCLRPVPADIGQGVALDLLQGHAIGIEEMTGFAADTEGELLANPDMAVALDFGSESGFVLEFQVTKGSATQAFHHKHFAFNLSVSTTVFEKMLRAHTQGQLVAEPALPG